MFLVHHTVQTGKILGVPLAVNFTDSFKFKATFNRISGFLICFIWQKEM